MRRRVFVVAGEYSANPRHLPPDRRKRAFLAEPHPELTDEEVTRLFFRFPNRSEDGRTRPEDWKREFALSAPIGLNDLFASAAHRALTSLYRLTSTDYRATRDSITDLFVTSMPGLDPNERMNIGLVPQALRAALALPPRVVAQYVVGTSDSGAWAFAQAVRAARNAEKPATIIVVAGQIIPAGYASQYQIRTVLGENDQARGLDMLAIGDLLMDAVRRNSGVSRAEVIALLERISSRKFDAAKQYPAGIQSGKPFRRDSPRTPRFDANDIGAPCSRAAACIVTSDEELALRFAAARSPRYQAAAVTEVLGVGEGSSNENFLHRQSPLLFSTAVREALAATADDARRPISVFASSAFGVAHDAFPSIELSFLLAMGLSYERSVERMAEGWPNPFGGLLTFGHALGASGLVQVNKAHHLFSGDQRYLKDGPHRRQGFRETGAIAFTSSCGGPLSHRVAGTLRWRVAGAASRCGAGRHGRGRSAGVDVRRLPAPHRRGARPRRQVARRGSAHAQGDGAQRRQGGGDRQGSAPCSLGDRNRSRVGPRRAPQDRLPAISGARLSRSRERRRALAAAGRPHRQGRRRSGPVAFLARARQARGGTPAGRSSGQHRTRSSRRNRGVAGAARVDGRAAAAPRLVLGGHAETDPRGGAPTARSRSGSGGSGHARAGDSRRARRRRVGRRSPP